MSSAFRSRSTFKQTGSGSYGVGGWLWRACLLSWTDHDVAEDVNVSINVCMAVTAPLRCFCGAGHIWQLWNQAVKRMRRERKYYSVLMRGL
jgi:hypothetical protein